MIREECLSRSLARLAAIAVVALGASACSSVPEWANPTGWIGGGDQTADNSPDNAQTPDLASIPDKPAAPSTADEREQAADTLKADRADAQYSADALRGGTEPSAPPPAPASAADASANVASSDSGTASAPAGDQAGAPQKTASVDKSDISAAPTSSAAQPVAAPVAPAPAAQAAMAAPAASADAAVGVAPTTDEQLGFQPSKAPPLDPNVARFVPADVINQVQNATAGTATTAPAQAAPAKPDPARTSAIDPPTEQRAAAPAAASAASYRSMATPASYTAEQQIRPAAVVFFPRDAAVLSAGAKAQVLAAAQAFQTRSETGFVRIVGHSSSRTANMPMARHLEVVFQRSQDFADAVAHELIRDGVPADKVLIEAVGDSQPVYYESMPQGEAGNRRAEIFM